MRKLVLILVLTGLMHWKADAQFIKKPAAYTAGIGVNAHLVATVDLSTSHQVAVPALGYAPAFTDSVKEARAVVGAASMGMVFGTLLGGAVGFEIGKGDRESLLGAVNGAIWGALAGNSLLIPFGVAVATNDFQRLPLSIFVTAASGLGMYWLARNAGGAGAIFIAPILQLTASIAVGHRQGRR